MTANTPATARRPPTTTKYSIVWFLSCEILLYPPLLGMARPEYISRHPARNIPVLRNTEYEQTADSRRRTWRHSNERSRSGVDGYAGIPAFARHQATRNRISGFSFRHAHAFRALPRHLVDGAAARGIDSTRADCLCR